jgi:hypothetical protein
MDYLPTKLNVRINYSRGNYLSIDWNGEIIHVCKMASQQPVLQAEISPSIAAWYQFWTALDAIEIWSWDARYQSATGERVECGGSWMVSIEYGNKLVNSEGRDLTYPDRFDRYERALVELTSKIDRSV